MFVDLTTDAQYYAEGAVGAKGEGGVLGSEVFGWEVPWEARR